ncbi:UNVERIFIED_CONTAM: secretory pathway Sec39 family protein, partial [Bacteroidetes bacterium 56_B9]
VLRIVLTFLPEAVDPREYTGYVGEVASRLYLDVDREDVEVSTAPVHNLSEEEAQKKVKKLRILDIQAPAFPPHAPQDLLTRFVCHRAYRIDQ